MILGQKVAPSLADFVEDEAMLSGLFVVIGAAGYSAEGATGEIDVVVGATGVFVESCKLVVDETALEFFAKWTSLLEVVDNSGCNVVIHALWVCRCRCGVELL